MVFPLVAGAGSILRWLSYTLLGTAFLSIPAIIRKIVVALGVGFVTYQGANALIGSIVASLLQSFSNMQAITIASSVVGVLNVDTAVSNIISAYTIRLTYEFTSRIIFSRSDGSFSIL